MESAPFALYHNSVWDRGGGCWDSTSLIRRGVLSEWVLGLYPLTCDKRTARERFVSLPAWNSDPRFWSTTRGTYIRADHRTNKSTSLVYDFFLCI